jgi:ATP-dependent Clp protease ATP-binding subunit ClpA
VLKIRSIYCIVDPFTGIAIGAAAFGGVKYFDSIKLNTYCRYYECCTKDTIPHDIMSLHDKLETKLFGQHIAQEKIFKAVASHFEDIEHSRKPLVMTFHGTQGTGKNYVASMIAEAVFEKGTSSKHFHIFHGSQYENVDRTQEHKENIKKEIFNAVDSCPYSLFVFDEVDKMPQGIFNSIKAILDHNSIIRGKNFKQAIFIFLTNYGGEEITRVLHHLVNKDGMFRQETKLSHFEEIMRVGVYNKDGGLKNSDLIESAVIDFYLPFLPLEEIHVRECIKEEFKLCNYKSEITKEMIDDILNYIGFNSVTNFAHTGCKTIYAKVQAECL